MKRFAMNRWILSAFPVLLALSASAQTKGAPAKPTPTPTKGAAPAKAGATPTKPAAAPPKATATPAKGATPARPGRTPAKTAPKAAPKPTPAPEKEAAVDPKAASANPQAALLQADADWAAAATVGKDMDRIVSYWAEDAVVFPPGENPVSGKGAARKHMSGRFKTPWFSLSWKPERAVVSAAGDLGYTSGTSDMAATDANGKVVMSQGRYLATWKRVGDGPWLCTTHVWNEGPTKTSGKKK